MTSKANKNLQVVCTGRIKLRDLDFGKLKTKGDLAASLGQKGVNLKAFLDEFNNITKNYKGSGNAHVYTYNNNTFQIVPKQKSTMTLLKEELKIEKFCNKPLIDKPINCSMEVINRIAKIKLGDVNSNDLEGTIKTIMGTAKSMGIVVTE